MATLSSAFSSTSTLRNEKPRHKERSVHEKKQQYIQLSIFFGAFSFAIVIYELISLNVLEKVPFTASWLISLLCVQVGSFYLFLLGYIYSNEDGDEAYRRMAIFSLCLNLIAFIMRLVVNLGLNGFLPPGIENF